MPSRRRVLLVGVWAVGGLSGPIETPSSNGSLYVLPEAALRDGPPRNLCDERALHRSFRQQLVRYIPVPAGTRVLLEDFEAVLHRLCDAEGCY